MVCAKTILLDGNCFERKFAWSAIDAAAWGGMLLSFEARGVSDVSMAITDENEVGKTRDDRQAEAPAYLLRFANYSNSRTCLEQRNKGRVQERAHEKLLHEDRFVLLWVNIVLEDAPAGGRTHISAGMGAPSPTTCLISYADATGSFCLSRVGFTTWDRSVEIRNLRATHHLPRLRFCPVLAPLETVANSEVWSRGARVAVVVGEGGAAAEFACSPLLLRSSSGAVQLALAEGAAGDTAGGAHDNAEAAALPRTASGGGGTLDVVLGDDGSLRLPSIAPAVFREWHRSVTHGVAPSLPQCALFGTDPRHLRKAQLLQLVRACRTRTLTDLTWAVATRRGTAAIGAHEFILTSLDYFRGMLAHAFCETTSRRVAFDIDADEDPHRVAEAMLKAVYAAGLRYTGIALEIADFSTEALMGMAVEFQKLGMREAVGACEVQLLLRVDSRGDAALACDMAGLASVLGLLRLRSAVVDDLSLHLSALPLGGLPDVLRLPRDVVVEVLRRGTFTRDPPLVAFLRNYVAAQGLRFTCDAPSEASLWAHEIGFAAGAPLHACPGDCIYTASYGGGQPGADAERPAAGREFAVATGGVLAHLRQTHDQNICRLKVVAIGSSSPKNPLSAGWKLFTSVPKLFCTSTETHPVPFVSVRLPFAVALAAYRLAVTPPEGAAVAWVLEAHDPQRDAWLPLDAREVIETRMLGGRGCTFTLADAAAAEYSTFRVMLSDGAKSMTLTHVDFYGSSMHAA